MKKLLTVLFACVLAFFVGCAKTRSYTVTFDGNGQTIGIAAQTVEEGGRAQEPAPPSAEGVDFGDGTKTRRALASGMILKPR